MVRWKGSSTAFESTLKLFFIHFMIFAGMPVCLQIFQGYFLMDTFIPFLDLDPDDVEPLRPLIDRDYVRKIADAFATEEWFEVHLGCMEYRIAMLSN